MSDPILVWRFDDAPKEFQWLSTAGGDEDWIAVVPAGHGAIPWAEYGTPFGVNDVDEHELPDGRRVLIGCHA